MGMQAALLKMMSAFRKPQSLAFCSNESRISQMMQHTEEAGKKDRKSPMEVIKVLTDAF